MIEYNFVYFPFLLLYSHFVYCLFLAHLSQRLGKEWSRRPCVCPSVRVFTLSNMNISETTGHIAMKFCLKQHWGKGKAALMFWPDWIRTLVSMATDSSHTYNGENGVATFSQLFLIQSFLYLQVTRTCMKAWRSFKLDQIRPTTAEVAVLERLKKSPWTYSCPLFSDVFDRIVFFFEGNKNMHMSLEEIKLLPDLTRTTELAAFERLNNRCCHFFSVAIYPIHFEFVGIRVMHNI